MQEMLGESHHLYIRTGCFYTKMLLKALLDTFAVVSVKQLKYFNRAVTINLNTIIEQSESFRSSL